MKESIILLIAFTLFLTLTLWIELTQAESPLIHFTWDPVTENADGTPCTDLAGYAIYRSDQPDNWEGQTGRDKAYKILPPTQTSYCCWCTNAGKWYWIIRAFDTNDNYSIGPSEIIQYDVDTILLGDLDLDQDIDGTDLSILARNFGSLNQKHE